MTIYQEINSAEEAAGSIDPATGNAIYALAYKAYQQGRYQDALPHFRCLTDNAPFHRKHWMGLASTLLMLKKYEEALAAFGVAAIQNPDDPYVHLYAADCLFGMKNTAGALTALKEGLAAANKDPAHKNLSKQMALMLQSWKSK